MVEKELKEDIPLKFIGVTNSGDSEIVAVGELDDLSPISQGSANNNRLAQIVSAKSLRIRLQFQSQAPTAPTATWKDGCALIRYLILSWLPYQSYSDVLADSPGNILDLQQVGTSGFNVLAPHLAQGRATQFRIHVDETVELSPSAGGLSLNASATDYAMQVTYSFLQQPNLPMNQLL